MATTFQDSDIQAIWDELFNTDHYHQKIAEIQDNYPDEKSLFILYSDLDACNPDFAMFLLDKPDRCLNIGEKALRSALSASWDPGDTINLRVTELPKDAKVEVRELRSKHLGRMVAIEGLVRKATLPKLKMINAHFRCAKCDAEVWVRQKGMYLSEPLMCPNEGCNKTALKFNLDEAGSEFQNMQKIEIQENPEGLRGGAQPERITGFIEDDVAGVVTPGNRVTLNGIIRPVEKNDRDKSTVFDVFMDVQSIEYSQHEYDEIEITEEDEKEILSMSRDPEFFNNLIKSISPTIYGLEKEKEAVALQLFGGTHKEMDDKTSIRGDIHVLMVGDPGVAKSQLLGYMSRLAPRGIYASGKSASAAGLCVSGETMLTDSEGNKEKIEDFVKARMTDPEEYRPGIWRQATDGIVKIQSISDLGSTRYLPATYVWKIATPDKLYKVTAGGTSLLLTAETKLQAMQGSSFDWIEAKSLNVGDLVSMVKENMRMYMITEIEIITEGLPEFVYDLTVDPSHAFVGSGFIIHNTAAAVKDDFGDGRWTLEAGALVLADKGLACIDELDKMSTQDRSSLHEAMESQRISIAKAGITATLQSRCSLLAAANPKLGRFDINEKIVAQIDLPPALMSRFDLIFVMRDKPNEERDRDITEHILKAHRRGQARAMKTEMINGVSRDKILSDTSVIAPVYDEDIIRKYVSYAKQHCFPVMSDVANKMIENDYLNIRRMGDAEGASVPITARQLEAYVRLSEASAKSRLSEVVEEQDAARAIDLINYYLGIIAMTSDGSYDIDMNTNTYSNRERQKAKENTKVVKDVIMFATQNGEGINMDDLVMEVNKDRNEKISASVIRATVENLSNNSQIIQLPDGRLRWVE